MSEPTTVNGHTRFALVTPSYVLDYEVCRLALDSVRRYLPPTITHYVIVSQADLGLFRDVADEHIQLLVQEDLVPAQFWRLPGPRQWRLSWKTLPVRGWIWQQLVKLSIANRIDADVYVILDSDCFFVRPFDPQTLMVDRKAPLFREERQFYRVDSDSRRWSEVSRRLLRLPPWREPPGVGYVGSLRFWRRDVLLRLQAQLSEGRGPTTWLGRIARNLTFSEYSLYGTYVEQLLGWEASLQYPLDRKLAHEYWPAVPMSRAVLQRFAEDVPADKPLVMINAKSRTSVPDIRSAFGF